jgi:hypothetical protein
MACLAERDQNMQILKGHISPESAYLIDDYPYGYTLRCKIRYWLEYSPKRGFRFVSQTTNPKRGHVWNKPKASTYARFGGAMFLDDNGHVNWTGLSEYCDGQEAQAFLDTYGEGVPEAGQKVLKAWVAAKLAYDGNRTKGDPLAIGLPEARKAFVDAVTAKPESGLSLGNRVRYTESFCDFTSTTEAGRADCARRRGVVVRVFGDGKLCDVDWGDYFLQFATDTPSLVRED